MAKWDDLRKRLGIPFVGVGMLIWVIDNYGRVTTGWQWVQGAYKAAKEIGVLTWLSPALVLGGLVLLGWDRLPKRAPKALPPRPLGTLLPPPVGTSRSADVHGEIIGFSITPKPGLMSSGFRLFLKMRLVNHEDTDVSLVKWQLNLVYGKRSIAAYHKPLDADLKMEPLGTDNVFTPETLDETTKLTPLKRGIAVEGWILFETIAWG